MAVGRSFRLVFLPPQRSRAIPPSLPPWQPRVRSRYEKGPSAPPPLPLPSLLFLLAPARIIFRENLASAAASLLRRLRPPCVATAAFSRPSVAEWSGAITFGLLTHSLRVFLRRRRRRRRQCLVTMDGSWRWSCGGVGREGPAPLRPPRRTSEEEVSPRAVTHRPTDRGDLCGHYTPLPPFPSPRGLFRDYTRHSFFRHRDPRARSGGTALHSPAHSLE